MEERNPDSAVSPKAIAAVLTGFLMLSTVSVLVKLQQQGGATIEWIVFIQSSTCLIITTLIASRNKFRDLKTSKGKFHLIRGVSGVLAFACSAVAMSKIPLVNAVLLNNTTPLFIPIISAIFLKIRINKTIWAGILTGFAGVILILKPHEKSLIATGDIYGLASGVFLAIAYVALKILAKTESFVTVIFYYSLISFVISIPFAINNWSNPPLTVWIFGVCAGILFVTYLVLLQFAYKYMEAVKLSPFNFSVIVFTGLYDWLLFHHIPDLLTILGIILVTAGGLIAIMTHEKGNKELRHHWL